MGKGCAENGSDEQAGTFFDIRSRVGDEIQQGGFSSLEGATKESGTATTTLQRKV